MLAGHQLLPLVAQHVQGRTDLTSRVGRFDDGIDEASFGSDVGVQQSLGVVTFELGALVVGRTGGHGHDLRAEPRRGDAGQAETACQFAFFL